MKVDWDQIIRENHKPSRVSRRLAKLMGGSSKNLNILDMPLIKATAALTGLDLLMPMDEWVDPGAPLVYQPDWTKEELYAMNEERLKQEKNRRQLAKDAAAAANRSNAVNWLMNSQIEKEMKEQQEDNRLLMENMTQAALLRNEQSRKAEAARILARQAAAAAQSATRIQAAKQSVTSFQDHLDKIQAVAAASAATKAQNLQHIQALAKQRAAAAAAEETQKKAILANSAQVLAQQNAEVARLRAEAMAKQSQMPQVMAAANRKVKAPQVKLEGGFFYI